MFLELQISILERFLKDHVTERDNIEAKYPQNIRSLAFNDLEFTIKPFCNQHHFKSNDEMNKSTNEPSPSVGWSLFHKVNFNAGRNR